ncbi:MAG: SAM-dependent DNA methyltransferase [Rhodothermaceae bacterium]|nr:SAM-dependent DNA methyltransferase [Rhodothermaceae bacterium]
MEAPLFDTMYPGATLTKDSSQVSRAKSNAKKIRDRVSKYLETALVEDDSSILVRDKDRVDNYGEVFTPNWFVKQMLDCLPGDPVADLSKSTLDPSCGNGQFLTESLRRKLVTAAKIFADSLDHEQYQFDCLRALSKLYGIDINADTAEEARARMAAIVFKAYEAVVGSKPEVSFSRAAKFILQTNIVVGDFLDENYSLVEWIPQRGHLFERKVWPADVIF